MCLLTEKIKFCTCKNALNKIGEWIWTLKRFRGIDWLDLETGKCVTINFTSTDNTNTNIILSALAEGRSFDFQYVPEEMDTLNVINTIDKKHYEFIFTKSKWQIQNEISAHLNKNLVYKKGSIDNANE